MSSRASSLQKELSSSVSRLSSQPSRDTEPGAVQSSAGRTRSGPNGMVRMTFCAAWAWAAATDTPLSRMQAGCRCA